MVSTTGRTRAQRAQVGHVEEQTPHEEPVINWRDVPTVVVDTVMAQASAAGIHRITLGEFVFNDAPNASKPKVRSVVTLALSQAAVRGLAEYFANITASKN